MQEQGYQPELTFTHKFNLFAGVIMPAISITVEATTHICAETFFDPIPTVWHLVLVIFVPLAQLHVWFATRGSGPQRPLLAGFANAIAIGISIFYSIVYIPLLPLAALALLIGLGILPLAPFLSLLAGLLMRYQLKKLAATQAQPKSFGLGHSGLLAGVVFTLAVVALIELPASLTRMGLQMATSASVEKRAEGIRFLRLYGSRDFLLRSCYSQSGHATDLIGYLFSLSDPIPPAEAQKIYYRVTGETFDTSIPPERIGGRFIPQDTFDFDRDQGGVKIAGKLKELSLASSKLDASVEANGGVGYMQWTLVFKNDSELLQREARAEVQLPPGGVVSRLTLWVNGEEREAAFAGRGKVREAYQQVVNQRRDPVLVTTAGRDRILVQCFPVPPRGEMKIRFGVTVPLLLEDTTHARLLLPHFLNRNFRIPDDVGHSVWVEATTPMKSLNKVFTPDLPANAIFGLRGTIPDTALSHPDSSIKLDRYNTSEIWSNNPFETEGFFIRQSIEARPPLYLNRIVLVVDTSATMSNFAYEIENAVKSLPPEFDVKLVLANADGFYGTNFPQDLIGSGQEQISGMLSSAKFVGGADNVPALLKAWDLAAMKAGFNAIVWIHSPQPLQLLSIEELRQRWERRPYGPSLYSIQIGTGSDEIEKKLDGINEVKSVARLGSLQWDLENLFGRLTGRIPVLEFVRSNQKMDPYTNPSSAFQASDHLARLWANDEVTRILTDRDESLNDAATALAVRYQLVTPVSGAVVLENEAQYRRAGLTPVDAGTVPTIPEPEMVALLIVAGVFFIWLFYVKYRKSGTGRCTV
jgi:Vault protein inter-alpha-trypsin domain